MQACPTRVLALDRSGMAQINENFLKLKAGSLFP
jgi:hypothetical protein